MFRVLYEKYLMPLFWPVFLVLISWGTYRVVMLPEPLPPPPPGTSDTAGMENVPFRSYKPRISEVSEDGTIRWELSSEEIVGIVGGTIELEKIMVLFTLSDKSKLTIWADKGEYDQPAKKLDLNGNIRGEYPTITLAFSCNSINYLHKEKQLIMSGDVRFDNTRDGVKLICPEVKADMSHGLSKVEFSGGVDVDLYKIK
jgi:hypothetical protein